MRIDIVILAGGPSSEREISLKSAEEILKYINEDKYNISVINVPTTNETLWIKKLITSPPDIIINLLHGGAGEDGSLSGLLKWLGIPYIGNSVLSGAVCANKNICKSILKGKGVPVCDDVFIRKSDNIADYEENIKELGFPVIIKPNNGGGSIGISISKNIKEVKEAAKEIIQNYNDDVLIEKFISGREVTCVALKNKSEIEVMPILDITSEEGFYDYGAKYINNSAKISFSTLPEFIQTMIKDIAKKVYETLECLGLCCVDLIVCEEQVYFIEANTIPGFTSQSILTRILKASNTDIGAFIDRLIISVLEK